jgi:hypothetical protein
VADEIIANPTYMEHVRHFFDDVDLEHMLAEGVELSTYTGLRDRAISVFQVTRPPDAQMPPDPARHWSPERHQSFLNWITNGFELGNPVAQPLEPDGTGRLRKDARSLSTNEVATVRRAFRGMMDLAPEDPDSYWALAAIHAYPLPRKCVHREDRYNPWHRIYLQWFEDAMRRVPGCADVTLPYWDITAAPPAWLYEPPLDSYTLQKEIHVDFPVGRKTERLSLAELPDSVATFGVPDLIALAEPRWQWHEFTEGIEQAHDNGHGAVGPTLRNQGPAAYDPIFWFFHCNWDRLWWEWQKRFNAATHMRFRSTITTGQTEFLRAPFNTLGMPFTETAEQMIDLAATGIGYGPAAVPVVDGLVAGPQRVGSARASNRLLVSSAPRASVRLKGVERLSVPGTFQAVLRADGVELGRRVVFQLDDPTLCDGCRERPIANLTFDVALDAVLGKDLRADIELLGPAADRLGQRFPLRSCGDPTLNVRLLLEEVR